MISGRKTAVPWRSITARAVGLLVCLGPCAAAPAAAASPAPGEVSAPAADDPSIEWKGSWDETYGANRKRWLDELRGLDADPRHDEMARRLTGLVRALLQRFGPDGQGRAEAYERIAGDVAKLGSATQGIARLKQLTAAFPGNLGLEVVALEAILKSVEENSLWRDGGTCSATAEHASDRLIALDEAGRLTENREAAESGWRMRLALAMENRRFWEADRALDGLAAVTGRDAGWYQMRVELLLSAGRWDDARQLLETRAEVMDARFVASRLKRLSQTEAVPPDFPRDLGLEMRWTAIHSRTSGADTATVQALLDASAEGRGIMPWEQDRHASAWVLLDQLLARQTPDTLMPLREAQQHPARTLLARIPKADDTQTIVAAYRRYPWAAATHKAMVACGEATLRQGASGLALRMFEDVLSHGADADLRKRARVGAWLAILNETRDAGAVAAAFDGVAPDAEFPWMGGRATAGAIRKRLLDGVDAADTPPAALRPATLSHQLLRLPPVAPWRPDVFDALPDEAVYAFPTPLGSLQTSGGRVLLAGPNLLVCFAEDLTKPLWWRTPIDIAMPLRPRRQGERGRNRQLLAVPGPFRPAMTGRCVYTRWGADPSGASLRGVAALDARTGEIRWSTDADPVWETMQPISDPAVAGGRVYVLAVQEQVGPILPVHLVCLDADRGGVLWQRTLGLQNPCLDSGEGYPFRRDEGIEQVRYGNAVTVHLGAVYCSTNLGFVARCDARDGMVEWVKPYPRAAMGEEWLGILRRQGAPPVVAGDRVIFMPRDGQGVFALDSRSGRRLWEAPLVPAEGLVSLAGGRCIVRGARSLFALDVGSGRVVWHRRLSSPILGRPVPAPGALVVAVRETLLTLHPATGETIEEKAWLGSEPPLALVLRGRTLAGVSRVSAGLDRPAPGPAAPDGAPLAAPVKRVWHLPRTGSRLWAPPPEANVPGRLYLASGGVLECVRAGPRKECVWQRFAEPDLVDVTWAEGTLILVCDRRLVALDAATGILRWDCRLPFQTNRHKAVGPHLVVAGFADRHQREPMAGLIDRSTGRLLWARPLPDEMSSFRQVGVVRKGDRLHLVSDGRRRGKCVHVVLEVADGATAAVNGLPAEGQDRVRVSVFGDEVGFYLTDGGALYEFALAEAGSARLRADLEEFSSRAGLRMDLTGPWLRIVQFEGGQYRTQRQWIFRVGDPSYRLRLARYGEVRGDVNYTHEGATLTVIDLRTRKETTYLVPVAREPQQFGGIFDFHRLGDRMWIASLVAADGRQKPATLQLDTFDAATGAHRRTQIVSGVFPQVYEYGRGAEEWEGRRRGRAPTSDILWTPEAIFVTDARGLHALTTAPKGERTWNHRTLVARAPGPAAIDGDLGEWDDAGALPLEGEGGRRGRLYLTHDTDHLYLAVRYADPSFVPHVGGGDAAGGDWLEIGLAASARPHRWEMGADARGRLRLRTLTQQPLPEGLQGAVRHDPAGGELVYEAAIPSKALSAQPWDMRRMGLSIAVWDEQPERGGPTRVLTWGAGVAGRDLLAAGHEAIYIDPLTQGARRAMRSIADELPDLPEAFAYVNESAQLRATSAPGLLALASGFLERHPKSMTVTRLLTLDRALRVAGMADPGKRLLDRAAAAGVPEPIRRRYAAQSQAYLSQWVYVPGENRYPRSIALDLFDGLTRPRGWGHRVYWVKTGWYGQVPAVYLSERFPDAAWHEIRVPLALLGMADLPICGIRYRQQGDPALVWDRTAVVAGGKEQVFLDDALPEGAVASGGWRWVLDPVHSGTKAHSATPPGERYKTAGHWVQDLKRPVIHHLKTPAGPYLSQWVYLDAKDPPRTVSLGLHDGSEWRFNAVWGEMAGRGRYMGPLPEAGTWQELRLPLAWTPLAAQPISGLYFAQVGGRAVWDRTALVAGGNTHVVIDDDVSAARAGKAKQEWVPWAGNHVGLATVAPGKIGVALECDGLTGQVEVPHSPALEPAEMTLEAWIFQDRWPQGGDIRRWIVNKNTNEEADGHYALVVNGMQVGAYLNIGGKEGTFQAWSGSGVLTLREWHHVAMTFDGRDLKVYHNGRLAGTTPVNRKRNPGHTPLHIGGRQDGYCHFGGRIDEVRLYGRALAEREVLDRYESAMPPGGGAPARPDAAQAGHWGFDELASPADLSDRWQWVDGPVKSGKRAHTQAPANGYTGHCCLLTEPLVAHLPYDPKRALAVLRRSVPALGLTGEAWRMVQRMLQLSPGPAERAETCKWFLAKMPGHWHAGHALAALLDAYEAAGTDDPVAAVEADLKDLGLPRETVYVFHRRYTHRQRHFVRSWQVLGPFPNPQGQGHGIAYPPETDGVDVGAAYDGASGRIRWQVYASPWEFVSLYAALAQGEAAKGSADPQPLDWSTAYAACWVHSDAARRAVLQVGHNDTARVWINRQLVLDGDRYAMRSRPEDGVLVDLPAGWSEVLLKTSNQQRTWEFYLELMDPLGLGPPQGVTFTTTPPAKAP